MSSSLESVLLFTNLVTGFAFDTFDNATGDTTDTKDFAELGEVCTIHL